MAEEARRFLGLTGTDRAPAAVSIDPAPNNTDDTDAMAAQVQRSARRRFAKAQSLPGTLGEAYLRRRGITSAALSGIGTLRVHSRCYYRVTSDAQPESWPALIAAVTDLDGTITGVHRTWLDPDGFDPIRLGKAPVETPRRAMGHLLGHAVRFGRATGIDVLAAGEGIETMLSLRCVLPAMPMAAALSAGHLAALLLPTGLRRLYIARDADPAGDRAVASVTEYAQAAGIEVITLSPSLSDFNDDLRELGIAELRANLRGQIAPEDVARFMKPS